LKKTNMRRNLSLHLLRRQAGATLVVALLVLILIMMIGITAVSTSTTQFKLAGNLQFEDSAMNNAESAVAAAEDWMATGINYKDTGFVTGATPYLYPIGSTATILSSPLTASWGNGNSYCAGASDTSCTGGNSSQRYVIQQLSKDSTLLGSGQGVGGRKSTLCNKVNTYQIIGHGISARGASKTVVSYFSVLNC
jgi:type IV pilus assembly protein PilX